MLDENIHMLQEQAFPSSQKRINKSQGKLENKKTIHIGFKPTQQYIADNGGTGSNPVHSNSNKGISQHDFYNHQGQIP